MSIPFFSRPLLHAELRRTARKQREMLCCQAGSLDSRTLDNAFFLYRRAPSFLAELQTTARNFQRATMLLAHIACMVAMQFVMKFIGEGGSEHER